MRQAQAIIFDMDGVIVDSEPSHEQALLEVLREIGYGDTHGLRVADYVGRSDEDTWRDFLAKHNPPHTLEDLLARKRRRVVEILRRDRPVFDGLPRLVQKLAAKYRLALASGSERPVVEEVLAFEGLRAHFAATVTATEVKQGKPAPDVFLRAAELLGVTPRECWVIEDSKPGIAAGLAAGMSVVAITNTHPAEELKHATHVVKTYAEIERLLLPPGGSPSRQVKPF
jgi:HAD superfamily hydrolase (TIGR01509 family)